MCDVDLIAALKAIGAYNPGPPPPGWPSEEAIDRAAQNAPDVHALVSEDGEREAARRYEDSLIRRGITP